MRVLVLKLQEILHDRPAFRAIIAEQHRGRAQMQFFDGRKPGKPERLSGDNDDKRKRGGKGKSQSEEAETLAACEQIFDQAGHAEPEAEQYQPTNRSPEYRAPAEALSWRDNWRLNGSRQQCRVIFRHDMDGAARRAACIVRIHHDEALW